MGDFNFQSEFSNVNYGGACRALKRQRRRVGGFWSGLGGVAVVAVGLGVLAALFAVFIGGNIGGTLAYIVILGGMTGFLLWRARHFQSAIREAPIRTGITHIRLTPEGYFVEHPGHQSLMRWSHLHGVIATKDALLILHSPFEFFPIEAKAFESYEHMQQVAEQIKDWLRESGAKEREE